MGGKNVKKIEKINLLHEVSYFSQIRAAKQMYPYLCTGLALKGYHEWLLKKYIVSNSPYIQLCVRRTRQLLLMLSVEKGIKCTWNKFPRAKMKFDYNLN